MARVTLDTVIERIDQHHKQNIENQKENKADHQIMKDGIAHTNGDVSALKLRQAKLEGGIKVIAIIITGILIPLVLKYLQVSLFS